MITNIPTTPAPDQFEATIRTALGLPHTITQRLYFNGRELQWLPKKQPGWFPVAVPVKLLVEAEEETVCAA